MGGREPRLATWGGRGGQGADNQDAKSCVRNPSYFAQIRGLFRFQKPTVIHVI